MSDADEAFAYTDALKATPTERGDFYDRGQVESAFTAGASRKVEAAPSDTDREALAELMYLTRQREIGATIMGWSWRELGEHYPAVTATWMTVADAVLAAGFSRTSRPVQVEVTDDMVRRADDAYWALPNPDTLDGMRTALEAALGGGDHAE